MGKSPRNIAAAVICLMVAACAVSSAFSQSQALDGQIEGSVTDQNGAAVVGATVSAANLTLGVVRNTVTNSEGLYRFPILPLGKYRISAEAANHKTATRDGLALVTGQRLTIDLVLTPGEPSEVVNVTATNPIADTGKTDLGRVLLESESSNLPQLSRNPYNFALLQPHVGGRSVRGFQFPQISVNGLPRRVNFLIDGNSATQADRAGVRLMQITDIAVKEVHFISSGMSPEFGNTPGLIINIVTPSGTNKVAGSAAYLFRLPSFYSRPFGFRSSADLPDNRVNDLVLKLGGPLVKDRWHLFGGLEYLERDDGTISNRQVTITEANRLALIAAGLSPSVFVAAIPAGELAVLSILRSDAELTGSHRLAVRFNQSHAPAWNLIQGGLNTLEKSTDGLAADQSIAAQLVSQTRNVVNEFRYQFVRREVLTLANDLSGEGPAVTITNVANFGRPESIGNIAPREKQNHLQNNLTIVRGRHVGKFGAGFTRIDDLTRGNIFARYTFPSIAAYVAAKDGSSPRSYTRYEQASGDSESKYSSTYLNAFAQDDLRLTARLKLTFGLRYDRYIVPEADDTSILPTSRNFKVDGDNFAPRLAAVYALKLGSRPAVLRIGAGIYYETPWLNMYERTLRNNGNSKYFNVSVTPSSVGAPDFPATFPPGLLQTPTPDIETIAPDLENLYSINAYLQFEQAINANMSLTAQYVHSSGRQIPVYRNINYIPIGSLADGRPVFSRTVNASTRFDPNFNSILIAESSGTSRYDGFAVQLNGHSDSAHFSAVYTFSRAKDNAPEQNVALPEPLSAMLTNPYDRRLDQGRSYGDQRHIFVSSLVYNPSFKLRNRVLDRLAENNQFGIIARATSGQLFSVFSNLDLNNDGLLQDRPVGLKRNSEAAPPLFNLDLRYSRFIPVRNSLRLETFVEVTNLFNISSILQFNNVTVATDSNGDLLGGLPDFRARNQSTFQESRQVQVGVKLIF